jgi:hypothetical protein
VLLLVLGALPATPGGSGKVGALVFVGAFLVGVLGLRLALERSDLLPDSEASAVVKYAASELNRVTEQNVIVVEGGSFADRGVDVADLHSELDRLGYSARVVRIALAGANHFERLRLLQDIERRLKPRGESGQRWLFLNEVHDHYDRAPLAGFRRNPDTTRTYHYLTAENAWYVAAALRSPDVTQPAAWRWPLFRHVLINSFNVGVGTRLVSPSSIVASKGTNSGLARYSRRFAGLDAQLEEMDEPPELKGWPIWLDTIREPRARAVWQPFADEWIYFGLPSTRRTQLRHVRAFCGAGRHRCIAPNEKLLDALDDPTLWFDRGHLNPRGSEVYSRWLARQLHKQGLLKR